MPIDDTSGHRSQEVRVRDRVEIFRQIGVDHIGIAPAKKPVRFLDGIDRAATRPIAISTVLQVRLENRLQHELGGGLNDPIPNRWDAERAFPASRLGNLHPPHRLGPIRLRNEILAQALQPSFHARRIDLFEGHPVNTRSSRVGAGQRIGVSKNILAADLVVEQIEAEVGLRLRLAIELSLKAPDLIGRFKAHRQSPSSSPSSKAHQKSGSFPPPELPDITGPTTLSDSRPAHRLKAMLEVRPPTERVSPDYPLYPSSVPCPLPRRTERGHVSIACLFVLPSPNARWVGVRIGSFEACSGFNRVTARWIARPPMSGLRHEAPVQP